MQGRGLRSVLPAHEQADDAADGVLLDSYKKINEIKETYFKKCVGYALYNAKNRDSSLEGYETELFKEYPKEIARPIISWKNEFSFLADKLALVEEAVKEWLSKQSDYKNHEGFIYNEFEEFIMEEAVKEADKIIEKLKKG